MKRRSFLINSGIVSGALFFPQFLKAGMNSIQSNFQGKRLIVIQLSGGNDGLNTIIPYGNDLYYKARPTLGIKGSNSLPISDYFGLNPSLEPLLDLIDQGQWAILNNVGYPNPNRSHFRSMDIWHTASGSEEYLSSGWLGRYLDHQCNQNSRAHQALEIGDSLNLSLKGEHCSGFVMRDARTLKKSLENPFAYSGYKGEEHDDLSYLYKVLRNTEESAEYLFEQSKIYESKQSYPLNEFGKSLKQIAELINSGNESSIYYASLSGFDTHVNQKAIQNRLLSVYSKALAAFISDLKEEDNFKDCLILTFSEFGRRVKQNAGFGTDHGTANNVFIMGENLKSPGLTAEEIDLENLDAGDLIHKIDFRSVYANIIENWFQIPHEKILNKRFNPFKIV